MFAEIFDKLNRWREVRISTDQYSRVIGVVISKGYHLNRKFDVHAFLNIRVPFGLQYAESQFKVWRSPEFVKKALLVSGFGVGAIIWCAVVIGADQIPVGSQLSPEFCKIHRCAPKSIFESMIEVAAVNEDSDTPLGHFACAVLKGTPGVPVETPGFL